IRCLPRTKLNSVGDFRDVLRAPTAPVRIFPSCSLLVSRRLPVIVTFCTLASLPSSCATSEGLVHGRLVMNKAAAGDDPRHVGEQAVSLVRGSTEIIEQDLTTDAAVFPKRSGIPAVVFYRGMVPVILSGMRFTRINNKRTARLA